MKEQTPEKKKIRVAIFGVGNCASSLVQGLSYYHEGKSEGLRHNTVGGLKPADIEIVAAFDIVVSKVGKPLGEAIFAHPSNTAVFCKDIMKGPIVQMGAPLDGIPQEHYKQWG